MNFYRNRGKRILDLVLGLPLLVFSAPIMAVVGVLVRSKLGSPVLFRQQRPGINEEPFEILKFRTMTDDVDGSGELLPVEDRLTRFGEWLRSTSLDELPELVNVIRGEMSLVGPRPLLMKYLPLYSAEERRRHQVRPGMTGWAQVNGRNSVSWGEKLAMDTWYVDNLSLGLDMSILRRTVSSVYRRAGVTSAGHATAPEFTGGR